MVSVFGLGNEAFGEFSVARTTGPPKSVFYLRLGEAASDISFRFASRRSLCRVAPLGNVALASPGCDAATASKTYGVLGTTALCQHEGRSLTCRRKQQTRLKWTSSSGPVLWPAKVDRLISSVASFGLPRACGSPAIDEVVPGPYEQPEFGSGARPQTFRGELDPA